MSDGEAPYSLKGQHLGCRPHGMVGSALVRRLAREEWHDPDGPRRDYDLAPYRARWKTFLAKARPQAVFLAAARAGPVSCQ